MTGALRFKGLRYVIHDLNTSKIVCCNLTKEAKNEQKYVDY